MEEKENKKNEIVKEKPSKGIIITLIVSFVIIVLILIIIVIINAVNTGKNNGSVCTDDGCTGIKTAFFILNNLINLL